jgi:hypothetical protein
MEARHAAIARDYLCLSPEAQEQTLILSGTNVERLTRTAELRSMLQQEGRVKADVFSLRSLRSRDRKDLRRCASAGAEWNAAARALYCDGSDLECNQLMLQGPDGRPFAFNPRHCLDKTSYGVQEIVIAPGEQLCWTRNEAVKGFATARRLPSKLSTAKAQLRCEMTQAIA